MTPTERIITALRERNCDPKPSNNGHGGKGWSARCPAHEDRRPSLSISEGEDGRVLLRCHAGCTVDAVCCALGLRVADLMPNGVDVDITSRITRNGEVLSTSTGNKTYSTAKLAVQSLENLHGERSALWTYHNAVGEPVGLVVRWDHQDGKKSIRPVSKYDDGWRIGGMPAPRPLYSLPDLADAEIVYIVEGEKAADAARQIGLVATTSAHGSQSADKTDWTPLAGKECILLPDHDQPGEKYAHLVVDILAKLSPAPVIKVVRLPDLDAHGDIADWVSAQGDADALELRRRLESLLDETEKIEFDSPQQCFGRYRPFPIDVLPTVVASFVSAAAEAIGCDPSFIALPLLACLARAIGNSRVIRLKRTWIEPAIIWGAIIGKSGTHKSPALKVATLFLEKRQNESIAKYAEELNRYEQERAVYEKQYAVWKRSKKEDEPPPWEPEEPKCLRYLTTDITIEALAERLADQFHGLVIPRDELAGWLNGIAEYKGGKGSDLGHWLSMWSAATLTVDRKSGDRKMIHVPRASVSIVGGIQPDVLRTAIGKEHRHDGLCARLLLVMPEPKPVTWSEASIDEQTEASMIALFERLISLEPAADAEGNEEPFPIDLAPEAKNIWVEYFDRHRAELAEQDDDLAAAWSKLEAYTARLALIFQLCTWAAGSGTGDMIEVESMTSAIQLSDWFGQEAARVYGLFYENDEQRELRELTELVNRKGGMITVRELMRSSRKWPTADIAEAALNKLVEAGFGGWEHHPSSEHGGRPTDAFVLVEAVDVDTTPANAEEKEGCVNVNAVNSPESPSEQGAASDEWGEL